jgi:hypothetical protein
MQLDQHLRGKADQGRTAARGDDLLETREGAAADEQDVGGVDLHELLLRMVAAALRRDRSHHGFDDLEQRLPHALARHLAGDRGICRTCGRSSRSLVGPIATEGRSHQIMHDARIQSFASSSEVFSARRS